MLIVSAETSKLLGTSPYNRGAFVKLWCSIDQYDLSGVCTSVGNGYYAPNGTNTRYACTNGGSHTQYTGPGGGTNNCPTGACVGGYYPDVYNGYYPCGCWSGGCETIDNSGVLDFGGMYGYGSPSSFVNPATGAYSCPSGYTATKVFGTGGVDYDAYLCWRNHTNGVATLYDFGGMFGGPSFSNPATNAASCPSGYSTAQVLGTSGVDWGLYYCYKEHSGYQKAVFEFGGMVGAGSPSYTNPATGAFSCPAAYYAHRSLGIPGVDYDFYFCYRWQLPPWLNGLSAAPGTVPGTINISISYSAQGQATYHHIDIMRAAGATPPADCSSGTKAKYITSFSDNTYVDGDLTRGGYYSYRICIYDQQGNLNPYHTISNVKAMTNCQGVATGGYCWYISDAWQACSDRCAAHGGLDYQGTVNYAGSGGSDAQCWAVVVAVGYGWTNHQNWSNNACGCHFYWGNWTYWSTAATTNPYVGCAQMFCACNE